jgi:hypothetical protein
MITTGTGKRTSRVYHQSGGNWYAQRSSDQAMMEGGAMPWGWSSASPVHPQLRMNRRYFATP